MKLIIIRRFTFLTLLTIFLGLTSANAGNVGILDVENILKNSKAMNNIQSKVSKQQTIFQKSINKRQEKLEQDGKKLSSKKDILSEDAFEKERAEFEEKIVELKESLQEKQEALKIASVNAMSKVNDEIKVILADISAKKKLDVIIPSSSALYFDKSLDISAEVLKRLNKSLTEVEVKFD